MWLTNIYSMVHKCKMWLHLYIIIIIIKSGNTYIYNEVCIQFNISFPYVLTYESRIKGLTMIMKFIDNYYIQLSAKIFFINKSKIIEHIKTCVNLSFCLALYT